MNKTEADKKPSGFDYESIEPGYYDEIFHRGRGVRSAWHRLKFAHVAAAMPLGFEHHLDIGCGPGTFIGTLPGTGASLGVDIAEAQVDYANEHYASKAHKFEWVQSDNLPFDDDTFDVVTIIELIEHLEMKGVERLLRESLRVLRPGGVFLATTPNYGSLWPVLEQIVNRASDVSYVEQHINLFRKAKLRNTLQRAGFNRVVASTFQGIAPFAATFHSRFAAAIQTIENPLLTWGGGFLLLGTGRKPHENKA